MTDQFALGYRAALEAAAKWLRQEGKKRRNDARSLAGEERAYAVASGLALEAVAFDVENLPAPDLRDTLAAMVLPLVWREARISWKWKRWTVVVIFGSYEILEYSDGSFGWNVSFFDEDAESLQYSAAGIDAAKAAAQADYTRRILAALGVME